MIDTPTQIITGEGGAPMKDRINTQNFLVALGDAKDPKVIAKTLGDIALLRMKGEESKIEEEQFAKLGHFGRQDQVVGLNDGKLLPRAPAKMEASTLFRSDGVEETDILIYDGTDNPTSFLIEKNPKTGEVSIRSNKDQKGLKPLTLEGEQALDNVKILTAWLLKAHLEGDINTEAEADAINARLVGLTTKLLDEETAKKQASSETKPNSAKYRVFRAPGGYSKFENGKQAGEPVFEESLRIEDQGAQSWFIHGDSKPYFDQGGQAKNTRFFDKMTVLLDDGNWILVDFKQGRAFRFTEPGIGKVDVDGNRVVSETELNNLILDGGGVSYTDVSIRGDVVKALQRVLDMFPHDAEVKPKDMGIIQEKRRLVEDRIKKLSSL